MNHLLQWLQILKNAVGNWEDATFEAKKWKSRFSRTGNYLHYSY